MKRRLPVICALVVLCAAVSFITTTILYVPEPDFCALCNPAPYHAPCLVNIKTGDITELSIYEPHAVKVGEVSEVQRGGYMSISMAGGVFVRSSPDDQQAHAMIPIGKAKLNKAEFCFECRDLLSSTKTTYVLADLYDADNIKIYDIVDGLCCEMRCYEVSATYSDEKANIDITNTGHLLDE